MTDQERRKKEKEEANKHKEFLASLAQPVMPVQKVAFGQDPKSVLCQYFVQGLCTKGNKCKFSHVNKAAKKSSKINLYTDLRDEGGNAQEGDGKEPVKGGMEDWDQAKLESVVNSRKGTHNRPTDIICKHFLDAIEKRLYGYFWNCPDEKPGQPCKYRHALPPGFILKEKNDKRDDVEEGPVLEDELEEERAKLDKKTPVTLETFLAWKARKMAKKAKAADSKAKKDAADRKAGRHQLSGRALFAYKPELFEQDGDGDDAMDFDEFGTKRASGDTISLEVDVSLFVDELPAELLAGA